ncbi:MAG: PAS domain S-box protein [Burkholderiales bacterium]
MPDFALRDQNNVLPKGWSGIPYLGLFGLLYFAAAWLGQSLSLLSGTSALLWLPNGLSVAVLLSCRGKAWPRLIGTLVAAEIVADILLFNLPLPVGTALAIGNATEVFTGAWLVRRVCGTVYSFQSLQDILALVGLAGGIAPLAGAAIGTMTFALAGIAPLSDTWPLWWLTDAVGTLIVAPLVLVVLKGHAKWLVLIQTRWLEMLALLATLVAVAMIVFANEMPIFPILLPVLLWAALRFGISGAAVAMAVIAAVAIASTGPGSGPFAAEGFSHATRVQLLQAFLGVCAVSTLVSAALIQQHWTDFQALKQARDELEQLVVQRTDALRISEGRFLGVAETMPGVVYQWSERSDGTFGFTYASPRIAEYFHVPADRPDEVLRLIHPEDVAQFRASIEVAKANLSPWQFEGRFRDPRDGSLRWWRAMSQPVSSNETEILFNGVLFDVTAEKNAAEALAESVRQLNAALLEQRALLTSSPAGIGMLDQNRIITSANQALLRMFGYQSSDLIGRSTQELFVSEAQWSDFGREGYDQMRDQGFYQAEVQYRRKDGSEFWGLVQSVQTDLADASRGTLFAIVDITRQKDAENQARAFGETLEQRVRERTAELALSEARNRAMLDLSTDWYWEQDAGFRYTTMIGNWAPLSQVSRDSYLGKTRWDLPILGVDESQWVAHRETLNAHRPFRNFVHQFLATDGSLRTLSVSGEPIFGDDGIFQGYRGIGSDITELASMAAKFRRSDARFQTLLSMSEDMYWEQDAQYRFTMFERLVDRDSPWEREKYLAKTRWELPVQVLGGETWESHRALLEARRPFKNLLLFWEDLSLVVAVNGKPQFDEQGQFIGYHGTARDVTQREAMIEALHESQRRLDLAFKASRLTLWDWDIESGQVFLNEQWAVFLGNPPGVSKVAIAELQALMHPDDAPRVFTVLRETLKGERPHYDVEHRVRAANGDWKWTFSHGMVTERDATGRVLRMTGTNADIDRRKRTEAQAAELLHELQAVLAASPAGIFTVDADRRILLANDAMESMFGYAAGHMLGISMQELVVSPDAWQWIGTEGYRQIRDRGLMSRELEYQRADGSRFWGLLRGVQIHPSQPDSENIFVVVDIDEVRQTKEALGRSETRFRALLDLSVDWYWEQDAEFRFTRIQGPASPLRNIDAAQILGNARWEIPVHGVSEEQWAEHRKLLSAHQPFRGFNYRMFDSNGKERAVSISGEPTFDESGRFNGYRGVGTDISAIVHGTDALRASQEQIRQLNIDLERRVLDRTRRLAAANHELEAFSYSVSHDLQAPLRRIGRYAELLTDRAGKLLDEPAREMLTSIYQASEHTRILIGDIMKLSKITQSELTPVTVNVSDLAAIVLAELAGTEEARIITTEVTADIQVDADPALLKILLDNLLGNAWKFTARTGNPRIEVRSLDPAEGSGFLVRDNGAGFDMRYAYKLFGSFQRLHGQDEFKGTGIGLAIVQRIVNLHGWAIEAEAEVGKGATFKVKTS